MFGKDDKQLREFYEQLPLGVLIEDYSRVKQEVGRLLNDGVVNLEKHFKEHPEVLFELVLKIRAIDANDSFLRLFKCKSLQEYFDMNDDPDSWQGADWANYYIQEIVNFTKGRVHFGDFLDRALDETPLEYRCVSWIPTKHMDDWSIVITTHEDVSERRKLERTLEVMACSDHLTGLLNRREFDSQLKKAMERIGRTGSTLALLFIDLDGFKRVNDEIGHEAGDEVLKQTASRIEDVLRKTDTAGRMGGDEFTIILEGFVSRESVDVVAGKLLSALETPFPLSNGKSAGITASVGIAFAPDDGENMDRLLAAADKAMYKAKELGKNQYCIA